MEGKTTLWWIDSESPCACMLVVAPCPSAALRQMHVRVFASGPIKQNRIACRKCRKYVQALICGHLHQHAAAKHWLAYTLCHMHIATTVMCPGFCIIACVRPCVFSGGVACTILMSPFQSCMFRKFAVSSDSNLREVIFKLHPHKHSSLLSIVLNAIFCGPCSLSPYSVCGTMSRVDPQTHDDCHGTCTVEHHVIVIYACSM